MTMSPSPIEPLQDIVIVGGGTAGWMTAAALAKVLQGRYRIRLVESDDIGTIGVGEATIPMIQLYNKVLEIDEHEFMRETQGTIKLGIEFVNWGRVGDRYMHGFGRFGQDLWTVPFDQYWHRMRTAGRARDLAEYSINRMAAQAHRFLRAQPEMANSPLADIVHAFHFDASLYARYLRRYAESRGVQRVEGRIVDVLLRGSNGHVASVLLEDGTSVPASCSLTAPASVPCSSNRRCTPATRTGATGCPATVRLRCRASRRRASRRTPDPRPTGPDGNGAYRCSIASATGMCSAAGTSARTRPRRRCWSIWKQLKWRMTAPRRHSGCRCSG